MAISESVDVTVTIECRECKSKNTKIERWEKYAEEKHKETDFSLDHEWWTTDSYKKMYHYHCDDCSNDGIEFGNKRYYS